jgi:hypothetical protein
MGLCVFGSTSLQAYSKPEPHFLGCMDEQRVPGRRFRGVIDLSSGVSGAGSIFLVTGFAEGALPRIE